MKKLRQEKGKDEKEDKTLKHEPTPPPNQVREFFWVIFTIKWGKIEMLTFFGHMYMYVYI